MPVPTPTSAEIASSLVLEALNRRMRMSPPGEEHLIEIGDDRLRVQVNNKVETDLRGAQPQHDLAAHPDAAPAVPPPHRGLFPRPRHAAAPAPAPVLLRRRHARDARAC